MADVLVVTPWLSTVDQPDRTPFIARHINAISTYHSVHVLHLSNATAQPASLSANVSWSSWPFSERRPLSLMRANQRVRDMSRDFALVHSMAFPALLAVGLRRPEKPWVHSEHWGGFADPAASGRIWALLAPGRHLARRADLVTVVSPELFRTVYPYRGRGAMVVVPNVVVSDSRARRERKMSDERRVRLVSVGRCVATKEPLMAIDVVGELRDLGFDASLTWVGAGQMLEECLLRAEDLGVRMHVSMVGGVAPEEVGHHLTDADVYFSASRTETFGVAAAEGAAFGLPLVLSKAASDVAPYWRAAAGVPVAEHTARAYAEAVMTACQIDEARLEASARALGKTYSAAAIGQQFQTCYAELLPSMPATGGSA